MTKDDFLDFIVELAADYKHYTDDELEEIWIKYNKGVNEIE